MYTSYVIDNPCTIYIRTTHVGWDEGKKRQVWLGLFTAHHFQNNGIVECMMFCKDYVHKLYDMNDGTVAYPTSSMVCECIHTFNINIFMSSLVFQMPTSSV